MTAFCGDSLSSQYISYVKPLHINVTLVIHLFYHYAYKSRLYLHNLIINKKFQRDPHTVDLHGLHTHILQSLGRINGTITGR